MVVTHGNGPQVGMINLALKPPRKLKRTPHVAHVGLRRPQPGYIGYDLQNALREALSRGMSVPVATLITRSKWTPTTPHLNIQPNLSVPFLAKKKPDS